MDDYEYLERAAIKEFCGNMSRYEAERQTREDFNRPAQMNWEGLFEQEH